MDIQLEKAVERNQKSLIQAAINAGADIDNLYNDAYIFAISRGYFTIANSIVETRNKLKQEYKRND